jgi:hypothetical protein
MRTKYVIIVALNLSLIVFSSLASAQQFGYGTPPMSPSPPVWIPYSGLNHSTPPMSPSPPVWIPYSGLNHEHQVAMDCVATYGITYTGGGCIVGRLTNDELNKCLTLGVGGNGCFGDNNTLVSYIRSNAEAASRERGTANQFIRGTFGISIKDIEENDWRGGDNSAVNRIMQGRFP